MRLIWHGTPGNERPGRIVINGALRHFGRDLSAIIDNPRGTAFGLEPRDVIATGTRPKAGTGLNPLVVHQLEKEIALNVEGLAAPFYRCAPA